MNIGNHNYDSLILLLNNWADYIRLLRRFTLVWILLAKWFCRWYVRWYGRFFDSRVHNRIPSDVTFIDTRNDFSPSMGHPPIGAKAGKTRRRVRSLTITTIFFLPPFSFVFFSSEPAFETRYRCRRVRHRICERERHGTVHQLPPLNTSILSGALSRLCFQVAKSRGETYICICMYKK